MEMEWLARVTQLVGGRSDIQTEATQAVWPRRSCLIAFLPWETPSPLHFQGQFEALSK